MSLAVLLAVFGAVVAVIVLWPFRRAAPSPKKSSARQVKNAESEFAREFGKMSLPTQLKAEREAVLQAVRELDFDYQTGKFAESDYRAQREGLVQRGAALTRQIETQEDSALEAVVAAARPKRKT